MFRFAAVGAVVLALAVMMGAFGAHALKDLLPPERLVIWETANRYHFYHGFALFFVEVMALVAFADRMAVPKTVTVSGFLFLLGLVLFSGSLYLLAYTGIRWLGAITPLGGTSWIIGWLVLAYALIRR